MIENLWQQQRNAYHQTVSNVEIKEELHALNDTFKSLIFLFGVLDASTEDMVKHLITDGIPMLLRPMNTTDGFEKERYERLVMDHLEGVKRKLAFHLLTKEEAHQVVLQIHIDRLLTKKREG